MILRLRLRDVLAAWSLVAAAAIPRVNLAPWPTAVAVGREAAAHFLGGVGAAVQAEAVAVLLGGKAVVEDLGQVLRGNADAVVARR